MPTLYTVSYPEVAPEASSFMERFRQDHVGAGANLLSFGRFQNVDGIGAGLGWFQR
jgi:hypothetical protein